MYALNGLWMWVSATWKRCGLRCDGDLGLLVGPTVGKGDLAPLGPEAIHDLEAAVGCELILDVVGKPTGDDLVCPSARLAPDTDILEHGLSFRCCQVPGGSPILEQALGTLAHFELD